MLTAHNQLQPSTGHKPVLAATFATPQQTQQRNLVSQDDDLFGGPGALLGSRFGAALGIDATICSACESPRHTTEASQPPSGSVIRSLQILRLVFDAGACGLGLVEPLKLWPNISPSDFTCESPRCSLIMFLEFCANSSDHASVCRCLSMRDVRPLLCQRFATEQPAATVSTTHAT